jgi:hypothetical protein
VAVVANVVISMTIRSAEVSRSESRRSANAVALQTPAPNSGTWSVL